MNIRYLTYATALLIICLDQFSKWFLLHEIGMIKGLHLEITSFFNLVMVWNRGVSFGMFSGFDARWPLIAIALMVSGLLLWWNRHSTSRAALTATGMVVGGAMGNVIDRLIYGAVADFFDVHVAGYHWPAFNIADMSIVCGVIGLLLVEVSHSFTKKEIKPE